MLLCLGTGRCGSEGRWSEDRLHALISPILELLSLYSTGSMIRACHVIWCMQLRAIRDTVGALAVEAGEQ